MWITFKTFNSNEALSFLALEKHIMERTVRNTEENMVKQQRAKIIIATIDIALPGTLKAIKVHKTVIPTNNNPIIISWMASINLTYVC